MLQPLLNSTTMPLLQQVARFAERRQEVLAGNVANIDTPGYQMRDLPVDEFQKALRTAIERSRQPRSPGETASGLMSPGSPQTPLRTVEELFPASLFESQAASAQPNITFQDANNRSVEHQFLQMTKNSMLQQFALELLRTQYDQLQAAITERV